MENMQNGSINIEANGELHDDIRAGVARKSLPCGAKYWYRCHEECEEGLTRVIRSRTSFARCSQIFRAQDQAFFNRICLTRRRDSSQNLLVKPVRHPESEHQMFERRGRRPGSIHS